MDENEFWLFGLGMTFIFVLLAGLAGRACRLDENEQARYMKCIEQKMTTCPGVPGYKGE